MNRRNYLLLLLLCFLGSCSQVSETEKFQKKRKNLINIKEEIKEIDTGDILISRVAYPYIIDNFLIIKDFFSEDKIIHLFNKYNFKHVTSFASRGEGPGEITTIGHIAVDEINKTLYITDHGKNKILIYPLDSILNNSNYIPEEKLRFTDIQFPVEYHYINDTLSIGLIMRPTGNSGFDQFVGRWNMNTGEIEEMEYEYPNITNKRISFSASPKHDIYVECYKHIDLMTIANFNGELKYNVLGNKENSNHNRKKLFYGEVVICNDKIIASYAPGINDITQNKKGGIDFNYQTQFLIFDLEGNYLRTLETEYQIVNFCYDNENNRLIINMDDEIQLGYVVLTGII